MKKVAVIGLGYVGLPLAALCAKQGYKTVGLDNNTDIVSGLASGKCHIKDETVNRMFADALASHNFLATDDVSRIAECNIFLICVPTPVDANHDPDLVPLERAVKSVAAVLKKGDLVVVESTVFPGTCEQVVLPLIEEFSGLSADNNFYLAHCPERVNPGDLFWHSGNIPRVLGALTDEGAQLAAEFYASILGGKIYKVGEVKKKLKPQIQ